MTRNSLFRLLIASGTAGIVVALGTGCGQPALPDLSGMSAAQAAEALEAAEFSGRFSWDESSEAPGTVLYQDPVVGEPAPEPRVVDVTVSEGTPFSGEDAIGLEWREFYTDSELAPETDNDETVRSRCSAWPRSGEVEIANDGLLVDPYTSPSGVSGGSLLVRVKLLRASTPGVAETLLAAERAAQAECAAQRDGSSYNVLPDAGAVSNSTSYSMATVAGYPALRTDSLVVAASPVIGGGVATSFDLDVVWRQERYLVEVRRTEIFGQTLPPRQSDVPSDLESTVLSLRRSVAAEIARRKVTAAKVRDAKQALRDAQTGPPATTTASASVAATGASSGIATAAQTASGPSDTQGQGRACSPPPKTSLVDLRVRGLTCARAQDLAQQSWFREGPQGFSCSTVTESRVSQTTCKGPGASFTYTGDPPGR